MKAFKTIFLLCCYMCAVPVSLSAQTAGIRGIVSDTTNHKKVAHAVVALVKPGDSLLYCFTRTGADGSFSLPLVVPGKYIIMVSRSRFADYIEELEVPTGEIILPEISLTPISKILQEVVVKSGSPMRIKGDTVIYTADSFKVDANANVEELLKRLPGIQVDRNGKITTMGEVVTKVLVDGEEFFGDDPGMAVKNLRADAVKEVQVFDKKSDQAAFSGIDDGQKTKTINLKLKEESKRGYFGKIELEGGLQQQIGNRYNSSAMINAFKKKRKLAAYGMTGNISKSGLHWSETSNFGDQGIYDTRDDLSGETIAAQNDYVDASNGFSKNWNTGLHYSNKPTDKLLINTSTNYSKLNYNTEQKFFSQTFIGDSVFTENSSTSNLLRNQQYKLKINAEWNADSMNVFTFTATSSYMLAETGKQTVSNTVNREGDLLNEGSRKLSGKSDNKLLTAILLWKHRFNKSRRTLSWNNQLNYSQTDATGYLRANNRFYTNGIYSTNDIIDQYKTNDADKTFFGSKLIYTEPLGKHFSAGVNYNINYALSNNQQLSFVKNAADKYEDRVDSLSNEFSQQITTHRGAVSINYTKKKLNWAIEAAIAKATFVLNDLSRKNNYHYTFTNFFPSAKLLYTMRQSKTILVEYRGFTKQPSINQLQPLRENSNPLNQYIGNPALKQSFSHKIDFDYNHFNPLKSNRIYLRAGITAIQNAFSNRVTFDKAGKRTTQPVNVNGTVNTNLFVYHFANLKKLGITYSVNYSFGYSCMNDFINTIKNKSSNYSQELGIGLTKGKENVYFFNWGNNLMWNSNRSSVNGQTVSYFTYSSYISFDYYITAKLLVNSYCKINYRQRTTAFERNNNNIIWDAAIHQKMLKEMVTIKFSVNDILNQNNNINRLLTSNTLNETIKERLQRYWLLSVIWNFKNGGKSSNNK